MSVIVSSQFPSSLSTIAVKVGLLISINVLVCSLTPNPFSK